MSRTSFITTVCVATLLAPLFVTNASAKPQHWSAEYYGHAATDYSGYQAPNGQYYNYSDFTNAIEGTPCGIECAKEHEREWTGQH
jgi:hypothetical protein